MKKLRIAATALALTLVTSTFAFAAEDMQLRTTGNVNLRRGPGTGYTKITSVKKDKEFDYTGISKYDSRGVVWHRVEYKNSYAWLSSKYSNVVNDGAELNDSAYVKATGNVNLRTGPGTGYKKLTSVSKGTKLFYLGEKSTDASGRTWYKVSSSEGEAWVISKYASLSTSGAFEFDTQPYVKTTASVNMRKGPGLSYGKVAAFSKGKTLTYLGESSKDSRGVTWYKVKSGSHTGWMSSVYSDLYK